MQKSGLACLLTQIGAAIVFAAVVTVVIIKFADAFYGKEESSKRGYTVDVAATPAATPTQAASAGGTTGGASDKPVDILPYLAKADLKLGEQLIKKCQVCHGFEKGRPNTVGPNQYGLVGRKVATVAGFDYSDAMKAKGGTWDFQALSDFLTAPQKVIPGTKMGFAGFSRPEERAAVIAYINKTYSDHPLPIPSK